MVIFHCHVSLLEGISKNVTMWFHDEEAEWKGLNDSGLSHIKRSFFLRSNRRDFTSASWLKLPSWNPACSDFLPKKEGKTVKTGLFFVLLMIGCLALIRIGWLEMWISENDLFFSCVSTISCHGKPRARVGATSEFTNCGWISTSPINIHFGYIWVDWNPSLGIADFTVVQICIYIYPEREREIECRYMYMIHKEAYDVYSKYR